MSSHDTRSLRQSKRMSVTALYLSMSAKDRDLEVSDELSRGRSVRCLAGPTLIASEQRRNISVI
jgi:Ras GTPase-activating-like protein IQGAP2/3